MLDYDRWLESVYDSGDPECPQCGSTDIDIDAREQSFDCNECDYVNGTDWDAVAESRLEAREWLHDHDDGYRDW